MPIILQHSFTDDTLAYVLLNGKWARVPCWIACALDGDNGGFRGLIHDYGLEKYRHNPEEPIALFNLEAQAKALFRYYRRASDKHYYNLLSPIERSALTYERRVRVESPHLHGRAMYERIADMMGQGFRAMQVKSILDEASEVLKWDQYEREARKYAELARAIELHGLGEQVA